MSIRDLVVQLFVYVSAPVGLFWPFGGILVWCIISYWNPHRLAWGLDSFRPALFIGIPLLVGIFIQLITGGRSLRVTNEREQWLFIVLWVIFTLSTIFAIYPYGPDNAWQQWEQKTKIMLMSLLTAFVVIDEKKLRYLLATIALSIGYYGFKGGIFSVLTGGQHRVWGPDRTFIADNNDLGLALLIIIPILYYLPNCWKDSKYSKYIRGFFRLTCFLCLISVIFTYSRGALLGLLVLAVVFLVRQKKKAWALALVVPAVFLSLLFIPDQWFDRMETIQTYEEDSSAMARINAWTFAWNLALDYPILGGGFGVFQPEMFRKYAPNPNSVTDAHSSYFEMLAENGFLGLVIYVSLLASCWLSLRKLQKLAKRFPEYGWVVDYTEMLELSVVAYVVSGAFLGRAYFDLFYHIIMSVIILKSLVKTQVRNGVVFEPRQA